MFEEKFSSILQSSIVFIIRVLIPMSSIVSLSGEKTPSEGLRSSSNLNKSPFTTISTKFLNPNLTKCTNYWKFHSPAQRTLATADNDIREQECNHLVFEGVKNHSVVKTEGNHGELNSIDQKHTASNIT
ncbi:hypothetical protein TNCV_2393781 [Trichonephila clavipes]|nr:hypothetical protein TNCV_2393781 [Trichonephila clavipes]